MKYLLIVLVLAKIIFANDFIISEKYFIDNKNNLNINQILKKNKTSFKAMKKNNYGILKNNLWLHLRVKNISTKTKTKRIYNRRAALSYIDVYVTKNEKILNRYSLGLMREYKQRDNIYRVSYFDLNLKPNETVNIYIKQKSFGAMETIWHMEDIDYFHKYFNFQTIFYFTIIGMLILTSISSFILFLIFKKNSYLIYTLFTIFSSLYQLSVSGIFYEFKMPIYFITININSFSYYALFLMGLFPLSFFQVNKNNYKVLVYPLKFILALTFIIATSNLFYPLSNELLYVGKYTFIPNILVIFILLVLSIKIYINKQRGSFFYLISNIIMNMSLIYFLLGIIGIIPNSIFYYYSLTTGFVSQDFFIAIVLIQAVYSIKQEHKKNSTLLNEYSKLTFIGQTILNISHQWKTPINSIFNSINHIEIAKEFKDPNINRIIDKNLKNIKDTTNYLNDIALSQLEYCKTQTKEEEINLYEEINFIIKLIYNELSLKAIKINFDFNKNTKLFTNKNYFLNVLMVLFENSYKYFEIRRIKKPEITISIKEKEKQTLIIFKDNALGINENITKIFDKNYSLNNSTGIGLFLANEIVTHKLNGNIHAKNEEKGLAFYITINH